MKILQLRAWQNRRKGLLNLFVATAMVLAAARGHSQWVAYNDMGDGPGVHPNVTHYRIPQASISTNGPLRDVNTGNVLPVKLSITRFGSVPGLSARFTTNPIPATPLYEAFNGYADFADGGHFLGSSGNRVTFSFEGLNPAKRYKIRGGAAAAFAPSDTNTWMMATLEGAESFSNAHSDGVLTSAQKSALTSNQAAVNFSITNASIPGEMLGWDEIVPDMNGIVRIICTVYSYYGNPLLSYKTPVPTALRIETTGSEPLTIVSNLQPRTVLEGMPTRLEGVIAGFPICYQWQKDGEQIAGATQSVLRIERATLSDAGTYTLVGSNSLGLVSAETTLTVVPVRRAAITNQPADQVVDRGETVMLSAGVDGDGPWWYQWYYNGATIAEGTNISLVITNAMRGDSGSYFLTASNPVSVAVSSNAILQVVRWPVGRAGSVDTNFMANCDTYIRTIMPAGNGKVYVGGAFTNFSGYSRPGIVRIDSDGKVDSHFIPKNPPTIAYTFVPLSNGKVLVGARGSKPPLVFRLHSDGAMDESFNTNHVDSGYVRQVVPQPDGRILIAGDFQAGALMGRNVARLTEDGAIDSAFNPQAGANGVVRALLLLEDGDILIGGAFSSYAGIARSHIARIHPDGSLDSGFLSGEGTFDGDVYDIQRKGNKLFITGNFTNFHGVPRCGVVCLNMDGTLDPDFNPNDAAMQGAVYRAEFLPLDQILVVGMFTTLGGAGPYGVARLNVDGSMDKSFPLGIGAASILTSAQVDGGDLLLGGLFSAFSSIPSPWIVRVVGGGGPFLKIGREAENQWRLTWHTNAAEYMPQQAGGIPGQEWKTLPQTPNVTGQWQSIQVTTTNSQGMFRLHKP